MARYQCPVCGYIFDEELEGIPFSEFVECPLCGVPAEEFEKLPDHADVEPGEAVDVPAIDAPAGSLAYPSELLRHDPSERHMETIHKLAQTGEPLSAAMSTKLPLPSWDDILILGAQLDPMPLSEQAAVDLGVCIGPKAAQPLYLERPLTISHMSFGALSRETKVALAAGAAATRTAVCSGEGGMLEDEFAAAHGYFFEYVPNRYSVTDENLRRVSAIEVKIGQGTKPGMGGHLPGEKVTPEIAALRGKEVGHDIISPSVFPGITSPEDLGALVEDLRERSQGRPIGIKLAAGHIEADLAFACAANPDFITIDGRGGATGSSPLLVRDATSIPTLYALSRARAFLDEHAPQVSLIITGGLRVASDFAKALALGADAVAIASAALIAAGCQQYRICGTGNCPMGIATQDEGLRRRMDVASARARLANYLNASYADLETFCRITGHDAVGKLSVSDLATMNRDIAERTGIAFV